MDLAQQLDAWLSEPRFYPYRGWHDPYDNTEYARPAIQQNREEFIEFIGLLPSREKCLQIGLGYPGASHYVFCKLFEQAYTIEMNLSCTCNFDATEEGKTLVTGNSHWQHIIEHCQRLAPFDLLFIDGDKTYAGLRDDYHNYEGMVSPGGVIAFHDTIPYEGNESTMITAQFMQELKERGFAVKQIGATLGISYFIKGDS